MGGYQKTDTPQKAEGYKDSMWLIYGILQFLVCREVLGDAD
jgi:hypothetical protein